MGCPIFRPPPEETDGPSSSESTPTQRSTGRASSSESTASSNTTNIHLTAFRPVNGVLTATPLEQLPPHLRALIPDVLQRADELFESGIVTGAVEAARQRIDRDSNPSDSYSNIQQSLIRALETTTAAVTYAQIVSGRAPSTVVGPGSSERPERERQVPLTVRYLPDYRRPVPEPPASGERQLLSLTEFLRESNAGSTTTAEDRGAQQQGRRLSPTTMILRRTRAGTTAPQRRPPRIEDYMHSASRNRRSDSPSTWEEYDEFDQIMSQIRQIGNVHDAAIRAQMDEDGVPALVSFRSSTDSAPSGLPGANAPFLTYSYDDLVRLADQSEERLEAEAISAAQRRQSLGQRQSPSLFRSQLNAGPSHDDSDLREEPRYARLSDERFRVNNPWLTQASVRFSRSDLDPPTLPTNTGVDESLEDFATAAYASLVPPQSGQLVDAINGGQAQREQLNLLRRERARRAVRGGLGRPSTAATPNLTQENSEPHEVSAARRQSEREQLRSDFLNTTRQLQRSQIRAATFWDEDEDEAGLITVLPYGEILSSDSGDDNMLARTESDHSTS